VYGRSDDRRGSVCALASLDLSAPEDCFGVFLACGFRSEPLKGAGLPQVVFTAENVQLRCLGIAPKAIKYSVQTCQVDNMDKKYAALSVWLLATTVFGALGGYSVLRELVQFYNLELLTKPRFPLQPA
jgi:hypothetical protein